MSRKSAEQLTCRHKASENGSTISSAAILMILIYTVIQRIQSEQHNEALQVAFDGEVKVTVILHYQTDLDPQGGSRCREIIFKCFLN